MIDYPMCREDDHAECVVCWNETDQRCSPCGDPVCRHCSCPSGCEQSLDEPAPAWAGVPVYAPFAA
jgi:hypothetical protein